MRGVPASVPGAGSPRLLGIERDIWAVVADVPLERFSGDALEREMQDLEAISRHAVAHASVIEFVFRRAPVIPLKLFTLFSSDEKVREHVRRQIAPLKRMFAALHGLEEWGVRVIAGDVQAETARTLDSGRDYLRLKQRLHEQTVAPPRASVRAINGALRALGRIASKTRKQALPPPARGGPLVGGASFLISRKRRAIWEKQVARVEAALAAEGHRLEISGPWPPYHFVSK